MMRSTAMAALNVSKRMMVARSSVAIRRCSDSPLIPKPPPANQAVAQPAQEEMWTAVKDQTTGGVYYWNRQTGETTAIGEPKPTGMQRTLSTDVIAKPAAQPPAEIWMPVQDKVTGGTYYWNQLTGETTAVGEPRPEGMSRTPPAYTVQPPPSVGAQLGSLVLMGAGVSLGFAAVGAVFRSIF